MVLIGRSTWNRAGTKSNYSQACSLIEAIVLRQCLHTGRHQLPGCV